MTEEKPQETLSNLDKLKALCKAIKAVRFDEFSAIDLNDRLALLTIPAGLRSIAAFGFGGDDNEGLVRAIRDCNVNFGIPTLITKSIWKPSFCKETHPHLAELLDRVDAERYHASRGMLLWVLADSSMREQAKKAVRGEVESGELLAYPECCIRHDRECKEKMNSLVIQGLINEFGDDPTEIEKAWREDLTFPLPEHPPDLNVPETNRTYPFVFHNACDACLANNESRSAQLNGRYAELALMVNARLHETILRVRDIEAEIEQIREAVKSTGSSGGGPDAVGEARLRDLHGKIDKFHAEYIRA